MMVDEPRDRRDEEKENGMPAYGWDKIADFCNALSVLMAKSGLTIGDIRKACEFCVSNQVPGGYIKVDGSIRLF